MKNIFIIQLVFLMFLCVFGSTGCGTLGVYNTATGRNEFIFVPTSTEVSMGRDIHQTIIQNNKISHDPQYVGRVDRIGQRLVLVSDRQDYQYNFFVIEGDDLNAYTIPGGNVYIYSGLLDQLDNDAEVAFVLAHEIGHCSARHTIKKFQAGLGYQMLGQLLLSQIKMEQSSQRLAVLSSNIVMNLITSAYSRQDEYEADRLGVKYMFLAGYDPQGAPRSLDLLRKKSSDRKGLVWLRSHPYLDDRIQKVREEAARVKSDYALYGAPEPIDDKK